ncbi:MAG: sigma-54-dependent Fis family transcriptional regulator [Desulfatitalea sp.]|nr:sigma-54-dependent Fis family transcriptional regulator [Desulfatitalea sp.]
MTTILIIDDDDQLRKSFARLLTKEGHSVQTAASGEAGVHLFKEQPPDLVILDVRLPGMSGLEAFQAIHEMDHRVPVIIMTAYGTTETAIEATKMGAFDFVLKPFEVPEMLTTIQQALDAAHFMRTTVAVDAEPGETGTDAIIGRSPAMQKVYKAIGRVSATDATVLIRGESGTGKELAARAIFQHSLRANRPFLVINCVAIPDTLLESELFGYEKGAFTGATHRRVGKIEQASGGTVFLDEIGDMPLNLQAKMLRLLQEKSVVRLGGRETIPVDVRIIAATNRDLETLITQGQFREDLYYRLKVITIWLPPMGERKEDIALLCEHFLVRFAKSLGIDYPGMDPDALSALEQRAWPGNVRELANTLQKTLIFNRGAPISVNDILHAVGQETPAPMLSHEAPSTEEAMRQWVRGQLLGHAKGNLFEMCMDHFAGLLISEALNITDGNRSRAAKLLGVSRPTLHAKIEKFDLKIQTSVKSDSPINRPPFNTL